MLVAVALTGLNDAVTPPGKPDAASATAPLNPFCGITVMMLAPVLPCDTARLAGDAESV